MKPIRLSFAGLQSYRERQEIDFVRLCEAGVFGIFGPTGSGKSTILDAMTLALYGKVERATGGTQGIINHAENSVAVSFTFELSAADGTERYTVERQYKRTGEATIGNTVCRLIRHDPAGDEVVADKLGEVNARIEGILGLSMQDFTRAVVLPQGKFAEFLSLTGKERRSMLQRLFGLEKYGDELMETLSRRMKEADVALKQIVSEQQGLGDASEDALAAAEQELAAARARREESRRQLEHTEQEYALARQLKDLLSERRELERRLAEWNRQAEDIARMEQAKERAGRAATAKPLLERWEQAEERRAAAEASLREAEGRRERAAIFLESARAEREQAERELIAREAALVAGIEQLRQALEWEDELAQLRVGAGETDFRLAQLSQRIADLSAQIRERHERRERAAEQLERWKRELADLEVSADVRRMLREAEIDRQELLYAAKRHEEAEAEWHGRRRELERMSVRLEQLDHKRRQLASEAERHLERLASQAAELSGMERLLDGWLHRALPAMIDRIRSERMDAERRRLAAALSRQLREGEPCPVCGSTVHPHKAGTDRPHAEPSAGERSAGDDAWELELEKLEAYKETASRLWREGGKLRSEWAAALAGSAGLPPFLDEAAASREDASGDATFSEEALSGAAALLNRLKSEGERCLAAWLDAHRLAQEAEREFGAAEAEIRLLRTAVRQAEGKAAERKEEAASRERQWRAKYAFESIDHFERELSAVDEKDRAAEKLKQRLREGEAWLRRESENTGELETQLADAQRRRDQAEAERNALAGRIAALHDKVVQRTQGRPARELIERSEQELQRLRQRVDLAGQRLQQAQGEADAAAAAAGAARQAFAGAEEAHRLAAEQWNDALCTSGFAGAEELKSALASEDTIDAWNRRILEYRETKQRLELELRKLDRQIGGRNQTEEQWTAMEAAHTAAREAAESALAAMAKAERHAEDVRERHVRWRRLEARRQELEKLVSRLHKLQHVFRGNAFVEFLAEEQLLQVSLAASERLASLTRRYAIEVDSSGGFVIRDDANGGVRRPVSSLSGGETFLTSLSLALALSAQIQLRGKFPLEFFFLDEGFGTLDPELLETVVTALERLHMERMTVGVISHVPELRARLPRRLIVEPAVPAGAGSRVSMESL